MRIKILCIHHLKIFTKHPYEGGNRMKILVCIKQVPESNKVEVDPVTGVLKRDGAASKMNPYDLYALETAFRIRKKWAEVFTSFPWDRRRRSR